MLEFEKKRPFQGKKVTGLQGSDLGLFFKPKNEKVVCKTQYSLDRILILGSYDSSDVESSDDAKIKFLNPNFWVVIDFSFKFS